MKTTLFVVSMLVAPSVVIGRPIPQSSASSKIVTSAQVNGTWRCKHAEFKIWALGGQKLKVEFSGVYEYKSPSGPMANTGEGSGVAHIDGDTASFKPDGAEDECIITMKFVDRRLRVTQAGICGFGMNVTAQGDYTRVSRAKPKFGDDDTGSGSKK